MQRGIFCVSLDFELLYGLSDLPHQELQKQTRLSKCRSFQLLPQKSGGKRKLRTHPTLWKYVKNRFTLGVK